MPIYEFQCPVCGRRFEELARAGVMEATCPGCGSKEAARRFSAPAPPRAISMSPGEARRAGDKRRVDRGGALERFKRQRAREKRSGGRRG